MAHLSLYRKYRSQTFAEVVGQSHVTDTLANAVKEDRLAHAYLFSGPRGTGKTSTARILAKALNCEEGPGPEPCNVCASCLGITDGASVDVVEIDAASHGSVDDARDLRDKVAFSPVSSRRRVYILDECHMLSPAANNALLKVLEEPPEHVIFVLVTTEPHKVLQTLLDRCQRYEFRPISSTDIAGQVAKICESEGIAVTDEATHSIAVRADGSMRDALTLLDQLQAYSGDKVTEDEVTALLGSVPESLLSELIDVISERNAGAVLSFTDRLVKSGRDPREFTRAFVEHLRRLFLLANASGAEVDGSDEYRERLASEANRFDPTELLRLIDLANEVQLNLRQAVEGRLAFEVGLTRMARPDLHATPSSLLSRIQRLERLAGIQDGVVSEPAAQPPATPPQKAKTEPAKPAPQSAGSATKTEKKPTTKKSSKPAPPSPTTPAVAPGELNIEKITASWTVLLQKVKQRKVSLNALLLQAVPSAYEDGELVLTFSPKHNFHREQVSETAKQGPLLEAFHETFGITPRLRCVRGDDLPEEEIPQASVEVAGDGDPVEMLRQNFEAEVVEEQ